MAFEYRLTYFLRPQISSGQLRWRSRISSHQNNVCLLVPVSTSVRIAAPHPATNSGRSRVDYRHPVSKSYEKLCIPVTDDCRRRPVTSILGHNVKWGQSIFRLTCSFSPAFFRIRGTPRKTSVVFGTRPSATTATQRGYSYIG